MMPIKRLARIVEILESVEERCTTVGMPATPTAREITQGELCDIYDLAKSAKPPKEQARAEAREAILNAWRKLGKAARLAEEEDDPTAEIYLEHQKLLNGMAFVWKEGK